MTTELITYHGWGFDSSIWKSWEERLSGSVELHHADRGYFGPASHPSFSTDPGRKVLIVHSFGLHWCPPEELERADHLVILSGYRRFHPSVGQEERRSQLTLRQMMSRFVEKPVEVVTDFYRNVYYPSECNRTVPEIRNHERLLEDLGEIDTKSLPEILIRRFPPVTIVHGGEDRIVPREKGRELFERLSPEARYLEVKHAGHAVAFTHSEECLKFLRPLLRFDAGNRNRSEKR